MNASYAIPDASFWLELGFQALVAVLFPGFVLAVRYSAGPQAAKGAAAGAFLVLFVSGALALNGKLAFGPTPPPLVVDTLVSLALVVWLAFSRIGSAIAKTLSYQWLIGFQLFRLPLELMMHEAHQQGVMPVQMSFAGYNYDILTGLSAIVVARLYGKGSISRTALWLWNLLGSALLFIIVAIAVLSMPTPLRMFDNAPPNVWVTRWPFVWLPTFLVPAALLGHLLVFRKLLRAPGEGRISTRESLTP